ncbi:MAG: hypothetical protein J2P45_21035 [Candidatus Dormibacteraeota bacterium]|nr:hypothetical protein [Candidatus Dormibacteraeota bacterium]
MRWPALIVALLAAGLLLAWADSTAFQSLFPNPFPAPRPRARFQPPEVDVPLGAGPARLIFPGLGPVGGLYSFGWFLAAGAGLALIVLGVLVAVPGRARRAAQRVQPGNLSLFAVAGVATVLLVVAVSELLRTAFIPLGLVPVLWAVSLLGIVFGIASLALALGRWLRTRLGPAPALLAALAAVLVLLDVALIPVAGWIALAAVAVVGLGVALVTRLGSRGGWSLEELEC